MTTKAPKPLKKKILKKKEGTKSNLNLKQNTSTTKKKRRSSKSKRRGSTSKKRSTIGEELERLSLSKKKLHGHQSSLSPGKESDILFATNKFTSNPQDYSKSSIVIKNVDKKGTKKKQVKLAKVKSQAKIILKKDKSNNSASRNKRKQKSPTNIFDKIKYQTLTIPEVEEI